MNLEQKRAELLKKRLDLLNEYLLKEADFSDNQDGMSFSDFLSGKGISLQSFIKDLPPGFDNPPASGYDNVLAYTNSLNQLMVNQMISALDKGELPDQYVSDEGEENSKMLSCSGCNGCGSDKDKYLMAEGGCGLPPVPPPFPKVKAIKKSVEAWDKYNAKKKKYKECRRNQKAIGHNLAAHLLNLSNPMSAIGRGGFLDLVSRNFLGFAQTFIQMKDYSDQSFWNRVKKAWYDFGGNPSKLDAATERGKNKKAIWRKKGWKPKGSSADGGEYTSSEYLNDGGAAEIAGVIAAAAVLLGAIVPIVKSFRKAKGQPEEDVDISSGAEYEPNGGEQTDSNLPDSGGLSTQMKWIIGLSIGVPVIGLSVWGIYRLVTKK